MKTFQKLLNFYEEYFKLIYINTLSLHFSFYFKEKLYKNKIIKIGFVTFDSQNEEITTSWNNTRENT